ncbi:MAG: TPM domain-containing protein [Bacteroidetes bacterium]|nr:TPM domain-containing protein [Bacteroidota bacterium]
MTFLLDKKPLLLFIFSLLFLFTEAKEIPSKPTKLVSDMAGILSADEKATLENKLVQFDDSTGNQIAICIEKSIEDEDLNDYVNRLYIKWGIGQKKKDNGVLIYVALNDKKVRIEVGYGLEAVVTDAASFSIIRDYIKPNFKQGKYYQGLDEATTVLMKLAQKEFSAQDFEGKPEKQGKPKGKHFLTLLFIIIFMLIAIFRKGGRGGGMGGAGWAAFAVGSGLFGGGRGGGDWGGGGGGGFGGFGGGSSGGGGASGSW